MDKVTHSIVLSVKPDMPYKELFERICSKISTSDGQCLYRLECTRLDVSHDIYLDVTAVKPSIGQRLNFMIPHSMVLIIFDNKNSDENAIGFLKP
jgi:hypothetical protein